MHATRPWPEPVKLLFDENLSHRLPTTPADLFPDSAHVRHLGMARPAESDVWGYAQQSNFAIVTQDSDFAERS